MNKDLFPDNFLDLLNNEPGVDRNNFIKTHQFNEPPTSIRLNPFKKIDPKSNEKVAWCNDGRYLDKRPSFTFDPLFHAGAYYVQEASSMFIGHILNHIKPKKDAVKTLDLCAAPGGKSTLINSAMNADDLLVANEIIKTRVPILIDN